MSGSDVQQYLDELTPAQRDVLGRLRDHIVDRFPEVTHHILYREPWFKLDAKPFVGLRATKHHLALSVWSDTVLADLQTLVADYDIGESTIRFTPERPIALPVVDAILERRAQEIRRPAEASE